MRKLLCLFFVLVLFISCEKEEEVGVSNLERQEELEGLITVTGCLTKEFVKTDEDLLRFHVEVDYANLGISMYAVIGYVIKVNGIGEDLIYASDRFDKYRTTANIDVKKEYLNSQGIELVPFVEVLDVYEANLSDGGTTEKIDGVYTIYGESTKVDTDLSYNSRIDSIFPLQTDIGQIITIKGKGFCLYGLESDVLTSIEIGGVKHPVIYKSDSILKVELSSDIKKRVSKPILENCGLRLEYQYPIEIKSHNVNKITSSVYPGEVITIDGNGFKEYALNKGLLSIFLKDTLNNYYNVVPEIVNETKITAKVPYRTPFGNLELGVVQLEDTILAKDPIKVKSVFIKNVVPDKFYIGDTIEILGANFLYNTQVNTNSYVRGIYSRPTYTDPRGLKILEKTDNYIKAVVYQNYLINQVRVYNRINEYEGEWTSFYDFPVEILKPKILSLNDDEMYLFNDDLLIEFNGESTSLLYYQYDDEDWGENLKSIELNKYINEREGSVLKAKIPMSKFYNNELLKGGYKLRLSIGNISGFSEVLEIKLERPEPKIISINKNEVVYGDEIILKGKNLKESKLLLNTKEVSSYIKYTKDEFDNDVLTFLLPNFAKTGENEFQFILYGGLSNVVKFTIPEVKISSLEYLRTDSYGNTLYKVKGENLDLLKEYNSRQGVFYNEGDKSTAQFLLFKTVYSSELINVKVYLRGGIEKSFMMENPYWAKFKPIYLSPNLGKTSEDYAEFVGVSTGRDVFFTYKGRFYNLVTNYRKISLLKFSGSNWVTVELPSFGEFSNTNFKYYEGKLYTVNEDELIFIDMDTFQLSRKTISDYIENDTTTYNQYKDAITKRYVYSANKLYMFVYKDVSRNYKPNAEVAMYSVDLSTKEIKEFKSPVDPTEGYFPEYFYISENNIFCTSSKNGEIYFFNFQSENWDSILLPNNYSGGNDVKGVSLYESDGYLYLTGLDVYKKFVNNNFYEASLIYKYDLNTKNVVKKIIAPNYKKVSEDPVYSERVYRSMYTMTLINNSFYLLGGVIYKPYYYNTEQYDEASRSKDIIEIADF
ncbi:IPT/TIG domain-containing protein [Wenyingzhuangia sp. chi5]|uniref:IPT/TIG domain-containing protein n=1 Tax=Wenyingzhuangia gilva TaxID=3057677 RepID=A0ABT8VP36_9FLAO|nr:IPT/TIG domain-containing protein [Wenyingzhuangia sp. chi5]MDO3693714.1 IPT/TIG domain-containing protein [Wenyingzhuangia sp. chi5]